MGKAKWLPVDGWLHVETARFDDRTWVAWQLSWHAEFRPEEGRFVELEPLWTFAARPTTDGAEFGLDVMPGRPDRERRWSGRFEDPGLEALARAACETRWRDRDGRPLAAWLCERDPVFAGHWKAVEAITTAYVADFDRASRAVPDVIQRIFRPEDDPADEQKSD